MDTRLDAHLIFQKIKQRHGKINVIPNNSERYISFDVGCLRFLDSIQFLSHGLDGIAKQLSGVLRGIYLYVYMNSMEWFDETSLPPKGHFFNKLAGDHISEQQYEHTENVWETLECNTMQYYHNHYLLIDILRLTDVFENFRKISLETYGLDTIGRNAQVYRCGVGVETDPDMHQMVEKSMCGGISNMSHRYATLNYPSIDKYNENEKPRTLTYQDANALYAWAMSQMLPLRVLEWMRLIF